MAVAAPDQIYSHEYFKYLQNRSKIRRVIRRTYLKDIQQYCIGKTIDFGCGIGELLKILPKGSIGYEVNKIAVEFCISKGLQVEFYDSENDNYQFKMIKKDEYRSFTMNHLLEHLTNSPIII
jgi:hypothetical protein